MIADLLKRLAQELSRDEASGRCCLLHSSLTDYYADPARCDRPVTLTLTEGELIALRVQGADVGTPGPLLEAVRGRMDKFLRTLTETTAGVVDGLPPPKPTTVQGESPTDPLLDALKTAAEKAWGRMTEEEKARSVKNLIVHFARTEGGITFTRVVKIFRDSAPYVDRRYVETALTELLRAGTLVWKGDRVVVPEA